MLSQLAHDRIRTLRVLGAVDDPLAARLALERRLGSTDLKVPSLPREAIVCVRRLRLVARPRDWDGWSERMSRQMQDLLPGAVHPFLEAVPGNAQVVIFSDEAELLACLARDWRRGEVHAWWWRGLFGQSVDEALVCRAFLEAPQSVPAAFGRLLQLELALGLLRSLPLPYCELLGATVAGMFAVPGWVAESDDAAFRLSVVDHPAVSQRADGNPGGNAATNGLPGSAIHRLEPPQRALLGIALLLLHAPASARAPGLVAALRAGWWWTGNGSTRDPGQVPMPPGRKQATRHTATLGAFPDHSPLVNDETGELPGERGIVIPRISPAAHSSHAFVPSESAGGAQSSINTLPGSICWMEALPAQQSGASAPEPAFIHSDFAGVLYLVNLALCLELYSDFTQPGRPGLALPLGDFLALVGERANGHSFREDPVWELLAELAGRDPDKPPGSDFLPPVELTQWLDGLVPTLERRAAAALGQAGGALPFLCARPGRLALSPTCLDVVFSLAVHPLEIRMAGLDRNPGWVPAAGRVIEFHYV